MIFGPFGNSKSATYHIPFLRVFFFKYFFNWIVFISFSLSVFIFWRNIVYYEFIPSTWMCWRVYFIIHLPLNLCDLSTENAIKYNHVIPSLNLCYKNSTSLYFYLEYKLSNQNSNKLSQQYGPDSPEVLHDMKHRNEQPILFFPSSTQIRLVSIMHLWWLHTWMRIFNRTFWLPTSRTSQPMTPLCFFLFHQFVCWCCFLERPLTTTFVLRLSPIQVQHTFPQPMPTTQPAVSNQQLNVLANSIQQNSFSHHIVFQFIGHSFPSVSFMHNS